MISGQGV